jgi:hypothetical protein
MEALGEVSANRSLGSISSGYTVVPRNRRQAPNGGLNFPQADFWTIKRAAALSGGRDGSFPDAPSTGTRG